jgi:hypothetical protein
MRIQKFLASSAILIGSILCLTTAAYAGDEDSGYNASTTDTTTIGSDPNTGGATQQDVDTMQSIQQQTQELKESHGGGSADDSSGQ